MKIIQAHPDFYIELSPEEIKFCPKHWGCSVYPIWLGKNRAIMKDVIKYFEKNPPESLIDCMDIVGHFGLCGLGGYSKPVKELFLSEEKGLDNEQIFW